jgi:GAF domain-containing protein
MGGRMTMSNSENQSSFANSPKVNRIDQKQELLQNLLNGYLILGAVLFFAQVYLTLQSNAWWILFITLFLFALQLFITFNWKLKTEIRSGALSILLLMVGTITMVNFGINALGFVYYLLSVIVLTFFHSRNVWIAGISLVALMIILVTSLTGIGFLPIGDSILDPGSLFFIISEISIFLFIVVAFAIPLFTYLLQVRGLLDEDQNTLGILLSENQQLLSKLGQVKEANDYHGELTEKVKGLIDQIYLFDNNNSFLQQCVDFINTAFDYGYCGIFISDDKKEFAVLKAGTGDAGKSMLARNHKLRIREEGMVGYVTARGEYRVSNNVESDPFHKFNPLLPDSKAELVLPLKIAGNTIGALDFQSNQNNAFQDQVIEALQWLADQLSLVYTKNTETAQLKTKISDLETSSSQSIRDYWQSRLKGSRKNLGFVFQDNEVTEYETVSEAEVDALQSNRTLVISSHENDAKQTTLIVPISIQDQGIGLLSVRYSGAVIPEELELLTKSLSEKLSAAIENAQLFEEIDEKSEREKVLNTISTNVRSARDIDSILRTTASELGKAMGVDEVRVHLKTVD